MLQYSLGIEGHGLLPLPRLQDINVGPPRFQVPDSLQSIVSTEPEVRIRHTYGKSYRDIVRGLYGGFESAPDAVALPKEEQDIRRLLDWCDASEIAVVPYGGGTSVVGGVEYDGAHHSGVLCLDMSGLSDILEVDPVSRLAQIQAGALGPQLEDGLRPHGLTLRHFPQSFEHSTLGGWIATRAGGHFATLYTHIDDLVASVRMLSPSGEFSTRTLPGSGAGPSPDRLAIGSEGALGIITEATMRVRPRPVYRASASLHFDDFKDAVHAARGIAQSGLYPSNCRLLDAREAALNSVTSDGSSVLIVAFESAEHALGPWLERAVEIARGHRGKLQGDLRIRGPKGQEEAHKGDSAQAWRSAFVDAPYLQSTLISLGVLVDTFETACTWSAFFDLHEALTRNVLGAMKKVTGAGVLSCRFTHVYPDGPAPYYTFIAPAKPGSELAQWADIKAAASDTLIAHGATITHHHAVGRVHRPWYEKQVPKAFLGVLGAAKTSLDPNWILNPGVLLAPMRSGG